MATIPTLARFGVGVSTASPDFVTLRLAGDDGSDHSVAIPRSLLTNLLLALLSKASELRPVQEEALEMIPLKSVGAAPMVAPDGRRGVSIRVEGGLQIGLSLSDEALQGLQSVLEQVARMPTPRVTSH